MFRRRNIPEAARQDSVKQRLLKVYICDFIEHHSNMDFYMNIFRQYM